MKTTFYIAAMCLVTLILYHSGYLLYVGIGIAFFIGWVLYKDYSAIKKYKALLNTKKGGAEYIKNYVASSLRAEETREHYNSRTKLGRGRIDHIYIEAEKSLELRQR